MKKIIIATLFLCLTQWAFSQTNVVGRVIDPSDKSPVPFATVAVFSVKDTSLVNGATTADNGRFTINKVPKGQYIFRVSFVGYETVDKIIGIEDDSKPFSVGRVELRKGVVLEEFQITETFIPVQIKDDTIEFNAEAFRPVEGSPLEELLKRLPGAEVDKDGKITIKGKEVTQILVDGEKFFSDDPKVASKNIPADYVQKVQTYEKKSDQAQFTGIDDGEEETVINLSFKPGMKKGWFGRLTAGGGYDVVSKNGDFRYDNSFNINYFRDKDQLTILGRMNNINSMGFSDFSGGNVMVVSMGGRGGGRGSAFSFMPNGGITQSISPGINFVKKFSDKLSVGGSYSYSHSDRDFEQKTYRENMLSNGTSQFYNEDRIAQMKTNQHRFDSEIRYTPSEDDQLTIRPSISYSNSQNTALSTFKTMDDTLAMINEGEIDNYSEGSSFSARLRTDYRHRFAKPRRTISFELDGSYSINNTTEYNYSLNDFAMQSNNEIVDQRVTNDGNRYSWSAQVAYTEPLIRDFTLELRYRISNSEDQTEKLAFDYDGQGYGLRDSTYSNIYSNLYYDQRFEIRIQKNKEKYRYSFGLGVFPANSLSHLEGRQDISQKVFNIAPQAQFRYNFSKQSNLNFRYSGRTNQPSVTQLQPVPDNSDPLNIRVGNPELKPSFNHRFFAMYNNFFENLSSIFTSVNVNMTQNQITNITIYDPSLFPHIQMDSSVLNPGVRLIMADNVDFVYSANAMLAYSTPIFSQKITLSSTTNGGVNNSKSVIDKDENVLNNVSLGENLRITYRLERFDVSLNGRIRWNDAKYSLQSERNNAYYTMSGGADFNWQIVKNKLILSSDLSFSNTYGYADGYNPRYTTWNAQLAWNIGKSNAGQFRIRIADILNDNKNTQRNATASYIEDITYNTLPRYVMLSFTYNLNTAKSQDAPQQDGVRGGGRRWQGPPPGGGGSRGGRPVIIMQ